MKKTPRTKARILVIDDQEMFLETVRDSLAGEELEVVLAANRQQALEQMKRERPDLVVLDLSLSDRPGDKSGFLLLGELRSHWPSVQVIVFTGVYVDATTAADCMRLGAYYYFEKGNFRKQPERFRALVLEALAYRPDHDPLEENLPYPLALMYRDYSRNVVVPYMKLKRMIELVEVLVKFASVVCQSARRADGGDGRPTVSLARASMGRWFEFLQASVAQSGGGAWIEGMRKLLTAENRRRIGDLINVRNDWIGHAATRADHEYVGMVKQWDGAVRDLLNSASAFNEWHMFVARSARYLGDGRYMQTVTNLKGHNARFLSTELELPIACRADSVYFAQPADRQVLSIDPFVTVFVCEHCSQETVFLFDKLDRERVVYLDYATGHHSARTDTYRDMHQLVG